MMLELQEAFCNSVYRASLDDRCASLIDVLYTTRAIIVNEPPVPSPYPPPPSPRPPKLPPLPPGVLRPPSSAPSHMDVLHGYSLPNDQLHQDTSLFSRQVCNYEATLVGVEQIAVLLPQGAAGALLYDRRTARFAYNYSSPPPLPSLPYHPPPSPPPPHPPPPCPPPPRLLVVPLLLLLFRDTSNASSSRLKAERAARAATSPGG